MKLYEKISIIIGFISTLLVLWHVFTPKSWQIEGFYEMPIVICFGLIGWALAIGMEKIN